MLLNKEKLHESMVNAEIQKMQRIRPPHGDGEGISIRPSRFRGVVDQYGHECGTVTKQYRLVSNPELVSAVDLASDNMGMDLQAGRGYYYNGRSSYTFYLPGEYNVPGDPSGLRPQITLGNAYGGRAALTGTAGVFRLVCTNGMTVGETVRADYQRHIGDFDLMKFVEDLLFAVVARAEAHKLVARQAADMAFETVVSQALNEADAADRERNRLFIVDMAKGTPKKYQRPLRDALSDNRNQLGHTVWSILQAISEVSTHDMTGWAAGDWQRKHTNKLIETVGITV